MIDLNADVGEGFADEVLLPFLTSASIACAAHAGDDATMRRTIALARTSGLSIGAHPGFPDREGFGRRITTRDAGAIESLVAAQVNRLVSAARDGGGRVAYVKPHGALYNLASAEPSLAQAITRGALRSAPGVALVFAAGSAGLAAVASEGVTVVGEGFVDRAYRGDGSLVPRSEPGATIEDPGEAARRAVSLARDGTVRCIDGTALVLRPRTLCLHGDAPGAAATAAAVRKALEGAGIAVRPFAGPDAPGYDSRA